jgi:hypothetical protein
MTYYLGDQNREDEMSMTYNTYVGYERHKILVDNMKRRDHLRDLDRDGKDIFKLILKKSRVRV